MTLDCLEDLRIRVQFPAQEGRLYKRAFSTSIQNLHNTAQIVILYEIQESFLFPIEVKVVRQELQGVHH